MCIYSYMLTYSCQEPFTAAFLPGSSSEFTVTPASGMLPAAGSSGALITVFFTPASSNKTHRARLAVEVIYLQISQMIFLSNAHRKS